jgi:hypothetical protein
MRRVNYINGISGVAPGGVATLNMPLNRRYHGVKIFATVTETVAGNGTASSDPQDSIEYVKHIVNGVVIRDLTPEQIIKIAQANFGGVAVTDHIPVYFSDPTRATIIGEEATSWDMFGQTSYVIEIKFKAGTTNPQATIQATYDFQRNMANGSPYLSIVKQHALTYNAPAGDLDIVNLPKDLPIQRMHIEPSSGNVTAVEVSADGEAVFEASAAENAALHKDYGIVSPFGYSVIFDYEQQLTSPLKVARELNLKPTFTASNNATIVLERISKGYA